MINERIFLVQRGCHILPRGYTGGAFYYVEHTPIQVPIDIDLTGTFYSVDWGVTWQNIPTIEPVMITILAPSGKTWNLGLLGWSTGGIQLEIYSPRIYDEAQIERGRKRFSRIGEYRLKAGELAAVEVSIEGQRYSFKFRISSNGAYMNVGDEWSLITDESDPTKLAIQVDARRTFIVGHLQIRRGRIILNVVAPYRETLSA